MTGREIIKAIMGVRGIANAQLAHMLGIAPTAMWERTNDKKLKDIPVSQLAATIRVMGYKVVVMPSNMRTPTGGYEVD